MSDKLKTAISNLKASFQRDPGYAWAWQCNLAMCAYDEGLNKPAANRSAARFMKLLFDIDMTKHKYFDDTQRGT